MRINLIDFDSKIPNLALMKLSRYHKNRGDSVSLNGSGNYDKTYISCVYSKNKEQVQGIKTFLSGEVILGGSGIDLKTTLPDDIEYLKPDYDLYKNYATEYGYSLGFTSRGCNRNCYFCIVSEKEGKFKRHQHPEEFYDERFDKIMFLDNNVLFDKEWFFEVMGWVKENNLKYSWNQGLDIRLLDEKVVKVLRENKFFEKLHFAWDDIKLEPIIRKKIKLLKDAGFDNRGKVQFFVYVDSDKEFESGLYRCRTLKELDANPFVMFNYENKRTKRIKILQRWANRKWLFWSIDYDEFIPNKK